MKTISVICSFYYLVTSFTVMAASAEEYPFNRERSNSAPQLRSRITRSSDAPKDDECNATSSIPILDDSESFEQRLSYLLFVQEVLAQGQYLPSSPPSSDVRISISSEESSDDTSDSVDEIIEHNHILRAFYRAALNLAPLPSEVWNGPDFYLMERSLTITLRTDLLSEDAILACISSIRNLEYLVIEFQSDDSSLPGIIKFLSDLEFFQKFMIRHRVKIKQLKTSLKKIRVSVVHENSIPESPMIIPDLVRNLISFMETYDQIKDLEYKVDPNRYGYKMYFVFNF